MYYCNRVVVESCGKVNLSLDITGTGEDGYHMLETVMQSIDLRDVLLIGKRDDDEMRVTCSNPDAPEDDANIAFKAAKEFFAATGIEEQGLSIHIDKSIPVEAGLAGGSADAAAVLRGLDRLFETSLSPEHLLEIGLSVGADVPFCLSGGCALAEGKGEFLTPLRSLPACYITIAKPPEGMSTKYAYKLFDDYEGEVIRPDTKKMIAALDSGLLPEIGRQMFSAFSGIMKSESIMLSGVMVCSGALGSVVSGSGSAVAGLFDNEKTAKNCLGLLRKQVKDCWLCRPTDYGARIIHVS
ncbi:MAG: 4-(cytidine 5'-diphospho)-2-C-methyl-D-erythritol kinase [Oscillospiraceae bacterium]|nr:4-(cytidine 5'-diphospho)-2-C-methyl-D-erythritol kinase [Oscillospiraceae bacterium]